MAALAHDQVGGVQVVRLSGTLNHEGVETLEGEFSAAAPDGARVVADLAEVDLMTTPGITMLIATARRLEESGGRMVVTGARGFVEDLIRRCRLDAVLTVAAAERDAVKLAGR